MLPRSWCLASAVLAGCWVQDPTSLDIDVVDYLPSHEVPSDWLVYTVDAGLSCPDGGAAPLYVAAPDSADAPLDTVILFHSGAFDAVRTPRPEAPLAGDTFQAPSRLTSAWAKRRAYAALGLYPSDDALEEHTGALPAAFSRRGIAVVAPTNCWGDLWQNGDDHENDYGTDRFFRLGADQAARALAVARGEGDATLPYTPSGTVHVATLGDGSRGAGAILGYGLAPTRLAGLLLDSPVDDLRPFWSLDLFGAQAEILDRVFPDGAEASVATSVGVSTRPAEAVVLVHSSDDSAVPAGANDALVTRLTGKPWASVRDLGVDAHVLANADDAVADEAVAALLGE